MTVETLKNLPAGTVLAVPLEDVEGNVAEKTTDGFWLVTGEVGLYTSLGLLDAARVEPKILRLGFSGA